MKKLFLIPILLIPLLIGSSGCDPDGDGKLECDQISMFCDIASSMIGTISANPIIPIATSFVVKGVVTNLEYQGKCEEPKNPATSETHTGYEVQYYTGNKSTDDDGWETIAFTDTEGNATELLSIYTQSLLANQDANINNSYEFEAAGQYRFIQNADHLNEEPDERDNENNGLTSDDTELGDGGKNFNNSITIIKVTDPEGKGRILKNGELPTVKYLGTEITYTMNTDINEQ